MAEPGGGHRVVWLTDDAVLIETELAVQVENSRGALVWLPKSQLGFYVDGRISVPRWLAEQRELAGDGRLPERLFR